MGDRVDVMAATNTARLSTKFQVSIPKSIRTARRWQAGQVFALIPKSEGVFLLPVLRLEKLTDVGENYNVGLARISGLPGPIGREAL
jgi:bifunctional DNA-binding transcriptional regulator/antitoxin component of YhaV-PrlF toxin-antitoxin module